MMNPEKPVIDDIDELIASECDEDGVPLDDYDRYDRCELCHQDWHGLPYAGCPGAYGDPKSYSEQSRQQPYIGYVTTEYQGVLCSVHLYADGRGGFIGLLSPGVEEHGRGGGLRSDLYAFDEAHATLTMHAVSGEVRLPIMAVPQLISPSDNESDTP
jgi:hypothetical protein